MGLRRTAKVLLAVGSLWLAWAATAELASARPTCGGRKATIVGTNGRDVIKTRKHGPQVIVARGGNDVIASLRNKDRVCGNGGADVIRAGTGRDKVFGGPGADFIASGNGSDKVFAGGGPDTIRGGPGGERVKGGAGADRLFGELQDDRLFGQGGVDLLVGGQGIDRLRGGRHGDWLRGDANRDRYFGEGGSDTLSFATATPPGPRALGGVSVNLRKGKAHGDEPRERVFGVENVVGSQFNDRLIGRNVGFANGGYGDDYCSGFASVNCGPGLAGEATAFISGAGTPDPGLVVLGVGGSDSWTITAGSEGFRVSGSGLDPGPGCTASGGGVLCPRPGAPLGYVLAWGGKGGDRIDVDGGFAGTTFVKVDGGGGSDALNGSPGDDLLAAGESGSDRLVGGKGGDALVSRPGRDVLLGGPGNDQLVTNSPCSGHVYRGGRGKADVAGFGHTVKAGVVARLNGKARLRGKRGCKATKIGRGSEVLEGTRRGDRLTGNGRPNLIIGREGGDVIRGLGGSDDLRGDAGRDRCLGGGGRNRLSSC
jgi:Ca2+-binding RTX toxin-like protein